MSKLDKFSLYKANQEKEMEIRGHSSPQKKDVVKKVDVRPKTPSKEALSGSTTFHMDAEVYKKLKKIAKASKTSVTQVIITLIE